MDRLGQDRIGGSRATHVEVDETWIGGKNRGEGRRVHNKTLVACAVEVKRSLPNAPSNKRLDGRTAGRVGLSAVPDRSGCSLGAFVESAVTPGGIVITDGWNGYNGLRHARYDHRTIAAFGDPEIADEFLPLVHLVFSNLKTWLNGIHHGVSEKHLQAYLNEFTIRFNRRFYPMNAFRSLLGIASTTAAPTYEAIYSGEWQHPTCGSREA